MDSLENVLIDLTAERVVSFTDRGKALTYKFKRSRKRPGSSSTMRSHSALNAVARMLRSRAATRRAHARTSSTPRRQRFSW
jgi:hypothetical protein